jgi:hypothetical protein
MHIAYNANTKNIRMEIIEMTKCREGLDDFGVCYKNGVIFYTFHDALPSSKLAPSWANSLKLRNFWDLGHAPSFQH